MRSCQYWQRRAQRSHQSLRHDAVPLCSPRVAFRRAVVRDAVKPMLRAQITQHAATLECLNVALDPRPARELSGHVEHQQLDSAAAEIFGEGAQQFVVKGLLALPAADRLALDDPPFP